MPVNELEVRLGDLKKTGERLSAEYGQCLDRAGLLSSVAKPLATDQLNAAKAGLRSGRYCRSATTGKPVALVETGL